MLTLLGSRRRAEIITIILLCFAGGTTRAKETRIEKAQLPKVVLDAFTRAYPSAIIRNCLSDAAHGATHYEIESLDGATPRDVTYSSDGKVLEIEETIPPVQLPDAVMHAMMQRGEQNKGKEKENVVRVERRIAGGKTTYEILVKSVRGKKEFILAPDGTFINDKHK